jgi:S1-C subfamily serine protease
MQAELVRLDSRIAGLERKLSATTAASDTERPSRPVTPEQRRELMIRVGVAKDLAADVVWRQSQYELDQLDLRDTAIREGWFGSERYRDELSQIEAERPDLRTEIGDNAYDRYLYASGSDNRVAVASIIEGSAAEAAGLEPGDLIESYDGSRIFTFSALREATAGGERDELVPVEIRRPDGSRVQTWIPRGPLGVRLDLSRTDPDAG